MEIFQKAAVIWFLIGFVFLLLEFVVHGLILFSLLWVHGFYNDTLLTPYPPYFKFNKCHHQEEHCV